ncbi:unnamed protein product [Rhizoctonia solani]|uniref:Zn(2)-C6 fungal-type domain-containing protein n=1 Tax=Rhizoctonia solani TaxID=456999 RepID=A0A8H3AAW5_9AGAM|nr:unnamed protein product [Rhizoctonia solani]
MSTTLPRSSTGCLTCKTRRKKCDETKPKCLRCQRLGVECPGYVYVAYKNQRAQRLRTLPAPPRINAPVLRSPPESRAIEPSHGCGSPLYAIPLDTWSEVPAHTPGFNVPGCPSGALGSQDAPADVRTGVATANNVIDFSWVNSAVGDFTLMALSDPWMNLQTPDLLQTHDEHASTVFDVALTDQSQFVSPPPSVGPVLMTPGQASLFQDLLSLGHLQDEPLPLSNSCRASSESNQSTDTSPSWLSPGVQNDNADADVDEEDQDQDPEGAIMIISRMPALDPNVESNALPFVLQNYAAWISRRAFEPLKLTGVARDLVFSHFGGGEESRWTLTLLANVGGTLARTNDMDRQHITMLSALHNSVFRQAAMVGVVVARDTWRNESTRVLETALETISVHFYVSPIPQAERLRRAAAPIFRRLCPDPPGAPINLSSLMNQPLFCLRHYAHLDILAGALAGFPMMFRYDTTPSTNDLIYESILEIQADSSPQWLIGIPDRIVIVFARINALREDGAITASEVVSEIEQEIRSFRPFQSPSSNSFLMVTRLMIQESWRQVAYIYLYMALCGESSEGTRVKSAMKQLMNLVNGTKPGRFPDDFVAAGFMMASPAARRPGDRQALIKRIASQSTGSRQGGIIDNIRLIEDYWARADAEGRPVVWSDVIISRIRVVGM